jgi:hypothetical protein
VFDQLGIGIPETLPERLIQWDSGDLLGADCIHQDQGVDIGHSPDRR